MGIAIVGAGVSGLSAAYLLSDHHDVTLFEAEDRLGGHARTVVAKGEDADHLVDTGFLVFNEATYPHFISLLERLGVASKESLMSFSYPDMAMRVSLRIYAQAARLFAKRVEYVPHPPRGLKGSDDVRTH